MYFNFKLNHFILIAIITIYVFKICIMHNSMEMRLQSIQSIQSIKST